jgi:hypothetical protein
MRTNSTESTYYNFNVNAYYNIAVEKLDPNGRLTILNSAKSFLQFEYVSVSVDEFNAKYVEKGWFGRKFSTIPLALLGVVKVIYHTACAIFGGFVKALTDDGVYASAQRFNIQRDCQEIYGRFISLYNDKLGQYHIQESSFNKSCYAHFLATNS